MQDNPNPVSNTTSKWQCSNRPWCLIIRSHEAVVVLVVTVVVVVVVVVIGSVSVSGSGSGSGQ